VWHSYCTKIALTIKGCPLHSHPCADTTNIGLRVECCCDIGFVFGASSTPQEELNLSCVPVKAKHYWLYCVVQWISEYSYYFMYVIVFPFVGRIGYDACVAIITRHLSEEVLEQYGLSFDDIIGGIKGHELCQHGPARHFVEGFCDLVKKGVARRS